MILKIIEIILPFLFIFSFSYFYIKKGKINIDVLNKINFEVFIPILVFYTIIELLPAITSLASFLLTGIILTFTLGIILSFVKKILKINNSNSLSFTMFNNLINLNLPLVLFILFGLIFNYYNIHLPEYFSGFLKIISQISIFYLFIFLGIRLSNIDFNHWKLSLISIILSPVFGVIISFIIILIFDYTLLQASLLILFGILLPSIVNSLIVEKYAYSKSVVSSLVVFGNIFSLISIFLILYFLFI